MPYYKAQHEQFVRALIRHGDQLAAYRQAYPKASKESAYTAAIRLLRQPHIQERVQAAMLAHQQREREREKEREEHKRRMAEEDTLQKRIWLASVVRGEVMKQRYMRFRGRTILVHETLSPFITLAAIELDTKYEYATNPKIILDRQFVRLYARAMRPIGERWLIRLTLRPTKAVISSEGRTISPEANLPKTCNGPDRRTSGDFSLHSVALHSVRNDEVYSTEKNTQNAPKKRTDLKVIPRQAIHAASNKPAVCNKIETHPVRTSTAVTHSATMYPAHYIIIDIDPPPGDTAINAVISNEAKRSVAQRETISLRPIKNEMNEVISRGHAIGDTAASRQVLRSE